jgi:glycosyltransferase involved in cell wall biosynthesis
MQQARKTLSLPADKQLILFCSQKVTDERKGMNYLAEALQKLQNANLHLVIVGKDSEQIPLPDGIEATHFGSVGEEMMPQLYNAVDVFVTPSLQDNLPNTIAEAMSCGTPCVGFDIGGIPEMIDHLQNGYVARYRQTDDLAAGIRYVLSHDLRQNARLKAASAYDETSVAQQYIKLYQA